METRRPTGREWLLIAIAAVALGGLGAGLAALVSDDGQPSALCLRVDLPPATSNACVNGAGETITSPGPTTTSPTTPTTTIPPSTESTTTTTPVGFDPGPTAPYPDRPGCEISEKIVSCYNAAWTWDAQNVDYDLVQIRITATAPDNAKKAVYLRQGSGHIGWLRISTELCDGAIGGIHDATIDHERIKLLDTSGLDCHNDGNQMNSTVNVTVHDSIIWGTGHSAAFIGAGKDGFASRNVIFDGGCWGALHDVAGYPTRTLDVGISIAETQDSGVKNVTIEPVKQHPVYVPSTPSSGGPPAVNPVNQNTTVPPETTLETCPDPIPAGY